MYLLSKLNSKQLLVSILLLSLVVLPFKNFVKSIFIFFSSRTFSLSESSYIDKIDDLKRKNASLSLRLNELNHLDEENEKLRIALNLKAKKKISLLISEIIAFTPSSWRKVALVNLGKYSGVEEGSFAIDENANLLGRIVNVNNDSSNLVFVNDPEFSVSVFIGKDHFGLLKGNLIGAKVLYIEDGSSIKVGDKVWLAVAPSGSVIDVGEVTKARKNKNSLFWDIDVRLFSKNNMFSKVFIIR